jgi:glycosyltransferase involved in cell wall biosynthesis
MTISLAMLVRNPEIDRLAALLEFVKPVVQQVVIVDTGSSDWDLQTMLKMPKVEILRLEWANDFSKARNEAFKFIKGTWTLVLDPDELPSLEMMQYLMNFDKKEQDSALLGVIFLTKDYFGGILKPEVKSDWHIRLFRSGNGLFYRPLHELVMLNGREEGQTRGTPLCIYAPEAAYLIHSKGAEECERDNVVYAALGAEHNIY